MQEETESRANCIIIGVGKEQDHGSRSPPQIITQFIQPGKLCQWSLWVKRAASEGQASERENIRLIWDEHADLACIMEI